jgi:hypothetical protein
MCGFTQAGAVWMHPAADPLRTTDMNTRPLFRLDPRLPLPFAGCGRTPLAARRLPAPGRVDGADAQEGRAATQVLRDLRAAVRVATQMGT